MMAGTESGSIRRVALAAAVAVLASVAVSGCRANPKHRYAVPSGQGRIAYDPERGIFREGTPVDVTEEELFRQGKVQFDDREFADAAATFRSLRTHPEFVDGARALDAIVMEAVALLEAGRAQDSLWLVGDIAGSWFDPSETYWRNELPERLWNPVSESDVKPFIDGLRADAIEDSYAVTRDVFDYYSVGLGVSRERLLDVSRHARNLAWVAGLAGDDALSSRIAADLVARQPRGVIEAQALLILAQSEVRRELYEEARVHFSRIYEIAPDATLRERALLGEIEAIIQQSKGEEYDRTLYDLASEKINEYKTDFLVQHNTHRLVGEFARLEQYVNEVIWNGLQKAASDYRRLFEPEAAAMADRRAAEFRLAAVKREERLRTLAAATAERGQ